MKGRTEKGKRRTERSYGATEWAVGGGGMGWGIVKVTQDCQCVFAEGLPVWNGTPKRATEEG